MNEFFQEQWNEMVEKATSVEESLVGKIGVSESESSVRNLMEMTGLKETERDIAIAALKEAKQDTSSALV